MPKLARLYLDTARLGLMSPTAQLAARDFARLAGEGVSTLYFQRFLQDGFDKQPARLRRQFPGLAGWQGMSGFQRSIRHFLHLPPQSPVCLASRTSSLILQTCHVLARRCKNVLVADTLWPPYRHILDEQCRALGSHVTTAELREELFGESTTEKQIINRLIGTYEYHGCDGILLTSISHDGLRLPVAKLLRCLRSVGLVELAVVDGAQELAHAPVDLESAAVDVYLAGCHKWLGAHLPLGLCCLARRETGPALLRDFQDAQRSLQQADPLQSFLALLTGETTNNIPAETVNVLPLVCAAAALDDLVGQEQVLADLLRRRQANASKLARLAKQFGWVPRVPAESFRTGILLLDSSDLAIRALPADVLQAHMDSKLITVTAYDGGTLRLSMPDRELERGQLTRIERALLKATGGMTASTVSRRLRQPEYDLSAIL